MTQAYPLHWPANWPRNERPKSSQFKTSLNGAIKNVRDSLKRFASDSGKKVDGMMLSSNVSLMETKPKDGGVALYFTWDGISTCIAVDRYIKPEENLQAIHHVVEAERTKLRHGGLNLVRAAFRGYAALPPPGSTSGRKWWQVLGINESATVSQINDARIKLAKELNNQGPRMAEVNAARDTGLQANG